MKHFQNWFLHFSAIHQTDLFTYSASLYLFFMLLNQIAGVCVYTVHAVQREHRVQVRAQYIMRVHLLVPSNEVVLNVCV